MSNNTPDPQAPRDHDGPAWDTPEHGSEPTTPEPGLPFDHPADYGTTAYDATGRGPTFDQPPFPQPDYTQTPPWTPPTDTATWTQAWDTPPAASAPSPTTPWTAPQPSLPAQPFPGAAQYAPEPWATGGYPVGYGTPAREHPQATTVLVLGILGLFMGITAPFAWFLGSQARREVAANPGRWAPSSSLTIGWALGVGVTLLGILAVGLFFFLILGLAVFSV